MKTNFCNYEAKLAINKSLLKEYSNNEYSRIVYMKDNSEFQIQLFNPYSYTIGIEIKLNDMSLGNMLVLKPGERIWLERYLNDNRKFLFSIYEVEDSKEAKKAIANNGNITIKFYKEKISNNWYTNKSYIYTKDIWDNDPTLERCTITCNYNDNAQTLTSVNYCSSSLSPINTSSLATCASTIETGRIERGSHSNQNFSNIDIDFESFPFKTENIKILPYSQKPLYKHDLVKRYCSNCGRKLNNKYKFCPYCGEKI